MNEYVSIRFFSMRVTPSDNDYLCKFCSDYSIANFIFMIEP
jgi:hypothetical protein